MSRSRSVTAAQNVSATSGSNASCPPARNHLSDGAGCSVNAMASKPAASAARATSWIVDGSRNPGAGGNGMGYWSVNFTGASFPAGHGSPAVRRARPAGATSVRRGNL